MTDRSSFRDRLARGIVLADGAMGTLLHSRGAQIDASFDELNLSNPALVAEIHRAYLEAGAEIIETNTFGANHYKLAEHGLADQVAEINHAGVELALRAAGAFPSPARYVAGSVGPLGVRLAPFGRVLPEQAREAFREQIAALVEAGVDLLMIETFSDLRELEQAVLAARDVSPDIPIVAEATFTRDDRTLMGDTPMQVGEFLGGLAVDVIGVNCSNGPAQIMRVLRAMRAAAPKARLSALPNAGWQEYVGGRVMYPAGPDYFAEYALTLRERGAAIIGGCCGTTPDHIAAMRAALDDPARAHRGDAKTHPLDPLAQTEAVDEDIQTSAPSPLALKLSRGQFVVAVEMSQIGRASCRER